MDETTQPMEAGESASGPFDAEAAIVGLLQAEREPKKQPEPAEERQPVEAEAPEQETDAGEPAEEGADAPEGDDSAEGEAGTAEPPVKAAIVPPLSWSKEEHAVFASLPPDVQATIARRESERDKFVASKANEAAAERQQLEAERGRYAQGLAVIKSQLVQDPILARTEEQWDYLKATDPVAYTIDREEYRTKLDKFGQVHQEQQALQQMRAHEDAKAFHEQAAAGAKVLMEKIPEAKDPAKWASHRKEIWSYLEGHGYSTDVLSKLTDANAVIIADKAMRYDRMMAKQPQVENRDAAPRPTMKPAARSAPSNQTQRSMDKLRSTGRVEDAALAILGGRR